MDRPLLIVFLGSPGSGKTYFARQLTERFGAVMLNGDALRMAIFGSPEKIDEVRQRNPSRVYSDIFRALDYAAQQTLLAGHTVVYDTQQTTRSNRLGVEKLAKESGAVPVLVWIRTDPEVALARGQEREQGRDSHQYDAEKMKLLIERFEKNADLPGPDENVIEISGEVPFEEQYEVFMQGIHDLLLSRG